jgi:hypothetical protein
MASRDLYKYHVVNMPACQSASSWMMARVSNLYCSSMKRKDLSQTEVGCGLRCLSEFLYKHFSKKVFVLID